MSIEQDPASNPAPEPTAPAADPAKTVGYEHFHRVVNAKQGLEAQVSDLKGQLSTALERAANVDTLAGQLTEAQRLTAQAEGRFQTYRSISGALNVTDPDVVELAEHVWAKLPTDGRPEIGDWLESIKGDPTQAPVTLRPFINGTPAPPSTNGTPAQAVNGAGPVTRATPRPPAATSTAPGAPASVSADAIRRARDHGVKTGDWSRYKEISAAAGYRKPETT